MKILFLDMDGVVLSGRELWQTHNNRHIPLDKIALVREICERTGAVVVSSSTWRYDESTLDLLRVHEIPMHDDWRTPMCGRIGSILVADKRGDEIAHWLDAHTDVTSYAIIDDDHDMLEGQRDCFVQTPFETGIDRHHVERLVEILSHG